MTMIKGSLLLSAPIVKHFQAKKPVQCVLGQNMTVLGDKYTQLYSPFEKAAQLYAKKIKVKT